MSLQKSFGNSFCGDHRTVRTRLLYKMVQIVTEIHWLPFGGEVRALGNRGYQVRKPCGLTALIFTSHVSEHIHWLSTPYAAVSE